MIVNNVLNVLLDFLDGSMLIRDIGLRFWFFVLLSDFGENNADFVELVWKSCCFFNIFGTSIL